MKIIHIANEIVSTGNGIVNSAVDLACLQSEAGHEVSFVSSGGGYVDLLSEYDVTHYQTNMYVRSGWPFFKSIFRIKSFLDEIKPDIVHAHMMTGALLMKFWKQTNYFGSYGLITTVHNEWRSTSNLMKYGDRVIVLSENGRKYFERRGFPADKLNVVHHGILHSPRRRAEVESQDTCFLCRNPRIITTLAGLYKRKGIGDLIRAFGMISKEFSDVELHIIGGGPDLEYLRKIQLSTAGSERIKFRGFIPKPYIELRKTSIFVLASHTETFPLSIAEAREAGCAIIATRVGGVPELLDHGRAGILIPPHKPDVLARELRRVLGNTVELENWRRAARSNLDWLSCQRMADETMRVYRSLLPASEGARSAGADERRTAQHFDRSVD